MRPAPDDGDWFLNSLLSSAVALPAASAAPPAAIAVPAPPAAPTAAPPAAAPAHESPAASAARRPRRRITLDELDRWRLVASASLIWAIGWWCSVTFFGQFVGVAGPLDLAAATVVQAALSTGQVALWRRPRLVSGLVGLALLVIDSGLNAVGGDLLLPAVSVPLNTASPGFWGAMALGLLIAAAPEALLAGLRRRQA